MLLNRDIFEIFSRISKLHTESFDAENQLIHNLSGKVEVEIVTGMEIIFKEYLRWENENNLLLNSKNVYRWSFLNTGNIKLDHLRFGKNNPVFLVELFKATENTWKSRGPHDCNSDLYFAELVLQNENPVLSWEVKGPSENYSLKTVYLNS